MNHLEDFNNQMHKIILCPRLLMKLELKQIQKYLIMDVLFQVKKLINLVKLVLFIKIDLIHFMFKNQIDILQQLGKLLLKNKDHVLLQNILIVKQLNLKQELVVLHQYMVPLHKLDQNIKYLIKLLMVMMDHVMQMVQVHGVF